MIRTAASDDLQALAVWIEGAQADAPLSTRAGLPLSAFLVAVRYELADRAAGEHSRRAQPSGYL